MTSTRLQEFERLFSSVVGEAVAKYGYEFQAAYSRPRGLVLEYSRNGQLLFASKEGEEVILDLVLCEGPNRFWRVSVNQALWFAGVVTVSTKTPIDEKLSLFASEMSRCCGNLLAGDFSSRDDRYCFPMSASEAEDYVAVQRGAT